MRDTGGWLLLHRCLIESPVFASPELLKVWIWCLCRAGYKKRTVPVSTGRGDSVVTLLPGEFLFGRKAAAKELNMPETTVRDRMAKLQRIGCVRLKPATHYTVVSIVKWRDYQPTVGEPPANQPPTNRHKQ